TSSSRITRGKPPGRSPSLKMEFRLQREVRATSFDEEPRLRSALDYWLSRPPVERLAAVEFLRSQFHGPGARLRRVHRVLGWCWRPDSSTRTRTPTTPC